jgi:hypothetical protein
MSIIKEAVQVQPGQWMPVDKYLEEIKVSPPVDVWHVECLDCGKDISHCTCDEFWIIYDISKHNTGRLSRKITATPDYIKSLMFVASGFSIRVRNKVNGRFVRRSVWELFRFSKLINVVYEVYA